MRKGKCIKLKIVLIIISCMFLMGCNFKLDSINKSTNKLTNNKEEEVINTITGVVVDATMNTITIENENNKRYSFEKNSEVLKVNKDGITIGLSARVEYYGELIDSNKLQEVKVESITIIPRNSLDIAKSLLDTMTVEEKVGQMFYVRCPSEEAIDNISKYNLGGYILFSRDFEGKSKQKVIDNINSYQQASKIKMLIGVDEEGGTVNRVSNYKEFRDNAFLSPKELYNKGGWDLIISDTEEKSKLLKSIGINVNMAPVCDITTNKESFMYNRSFSEDVDLTTEYVKKVTNIMKENRIGSVLKHFPGYGDNLDTHTGIAIDNRDYSEFIQRDFKPFIGGIEQGTGAILVSHNIIEAMDSQYPASLSKTVHEVLRNELNFNGVVMTDDLLMDAIKNYTKDDEAAVLAVKAGNDLICTTDFQVQIPAVINAVKKGYISEEEINASVLRILLWKIDLGII